jgi:hypothetical protein
MSEGMAIQFPERDVQRLFRAIDAGVKYLDMDINHALNKAGYFVVRSIVASTKTAPKKRKLQQINMPLPHNLKGRKLQSFAVTGYFGKPRTYQTKIVYSKDASTATKRHAIIGRRGLAKAAWRSGAKSAGIRGGGKTLSGVGGDIQRLAKSYSSGAKGKGYIEFSTHLDYAQKALRGGAKTIDTAMERASNSMMKDIENKLIKKMGFGWLQA